MPTTLSNPTHRPVKGTYGFRAAQWERARERGPKNCLSCGRGHLSPPEAKAGRCWRCSDPKAQDQLAADTADLYTGEPTAEPSLAGLIDNLEAARERIAKLDAMSDGEEATPVQPPEPGDFRCPGCGWLRPTTERVTVYVKHYCRVIATIEACRPCSSEVSVCVRG